MESLEILDDIIQVVYHSFQRYVLISSVDDQYWGLQLVLTPGRGKAGSQSACWRCRWADKDIFDKLGSDTTAKSLKSFAERVLRSIKQGEIKIEDFKEEGPADVLTLVFDTTQVEPICIRLSLVSPQDALDLLASFAFMVGVQAQSRNSRISAPTVSESRAILALDTSTAPTGKRGNGDENVSMAEPQHLTRTTDQGHEVPIPMAATKVAEVSQESSLKRKLANATTHDSGGVSNTANVAASKANPTRVKRVAKKMQFESDSE